MQRVGDAGRAGCGATVRVVEIASAGSFGTLALVDQLIRLRERVPLGEADIAAATGADPETIREWIARQAAPTGLAAVRLVELIAACKRLEVSTEPAAIVDWLRRQVPALGGSTPLAAVASGGYEWIAGFAEALIHPPPT